MLQCCRPPAIDPAARPSRTALPHLLAVGHHDQISDHTVWEIIDRAVLRAWLPRADDPDAWSERVDQLQHLRVWLRSGASASHGALAQLRARLRGRYLSIPIRTPTATGARSGGVSLLKRLEAYG